jgi:hypothetical protein
MYFTRSKKMPSLICPLWWRSACWWKWEHRGSGRWPEGAIKRREVLGELRHKADTCASNGSVERIDRMVAGAEARRNVALASRLARSNQDWHRLLEFCAITSTLVGFQMIDGRSPRMDFDRPARRLSVGGKGCAKID